MERNRRWTCSEQRENEAYPFVIRVGNDVVCQAREKSAADLICWSRAEAIRESSGRAADARRYLLLQKRLEKDIRMLVEKLEEAGDVLRNRRAREVLRVREEIRRILNTMKARGYCP